MADLLVPMKRSAPTRKQLLDTLVSIWEDFAHAPPTRLGVALIWAQIAHETGRLQHCYCFNFAGQKHVKGDGRDYFISPTKERINGQLVSVRAMFRAYSTLEAGLRDYLRMLALQHNFASAWAVLTSHNPDLHSYVLALHQGHWFTDDPAIYERDMRVYVAEALGDPAFDGPPTKPDTPQSIAPPPPDTTGWTDETSFRDVDLPRAGEGSDLIHDPDAPSYLAGLPDLTKEPKA